MKVRIKKGALVCQDFGVYEWPYKDLADLDVVFEVSDFAKERVQLVADGFGLLNKPGFYGNGALYVKKEDLRMIPDNQFTDFPIFRIIENDYLKNGAKIEVRDDKVCLIRADGETVGRGDTLQELFSELILILC